MCRSRHSIDALAGPLSTGIILANVASAAGQILVVSVAGPTLLPKATVLMGAPIGVGLLGSAAAVWWLRRGNGERPHAEIDLSNPLELRPALLMAIAFSVILAVSELARRALGASGVVGAAALAGSTDVHAATLAAATIASTGSITVEVALAAILVAFLVNMAVKLGIVAFAGGPRLLFLTAPPLGAMAFAAIAAYAAIR